MTVHSRFLSTPSARRATFLLFFFGEFIEISIHALREEGDVAADAELYVAEKFLSTPSARRATTPFMVQPHFAQFLSTPSARRATS